jgi:Retrotransposon gag protein.
LKKCHQVGSVQNYIAEFTAIAFQINDMSDDEKFHKFKDGLKDNIRHEMERRTLPKDLWTWQSQAQYLMTYFLVKEKQ